MKGVSPVLAVMLMVAIAIVGVIVYSQITNMRSEIQTAAAEVAHSHITNIQSEVLTETAQRAQSVGTERVVIEAFKCNSDTNQITFYMRNVSSSSISGTLLVNIKDSTGKILCSTQVTMISALSSGSTSGYTVDLSNCPSSYDSCSELSGEGQIVVEVRTPGGSTAVSAPQKID